MLYKVKATHKELEGKQTDTQTQPMHFFLTQAVAALLNIGYMTPPLYHL
jgi:Holliday junction resolvasome RuvABC DNA-binding subunit